MFAADAVVTHTLASDTDTGSTRTQRCKTKVEVVILVQVYCCLNLVYHVCYRQSVLVFGIKQQNLVFEEVFFLMILNITNSVMAHEHPLVCSLLSFVVLSSAVVIFSIILHRV